MMRCLVCPNTIDDKKDFTVKGPQGQDLDDTVGRLRHFDELGRWTHVTLTAQFSFTQVLLSGHVCPAHKVEPGRFVLVDAAPAISVQDGRQIIDPGHQEESPVLTGQQLLAPAPAVRQPMIPKNQAPAAPTAAPAPQSPATPTVRRKETQS